LGSLLMGLGFCVAARSWWVGVALVAMFFAIYLPVIRGEEDVFAAEVSGV
jgi:protein-S-isoprenylcysteine O-methyltransferase Ste14